MADKKYFDEPVIPNSPVMLSFVLLKVYKHFDDRNMTLSELRVYTAVLMSTVEMPTGIPLNKLAKDVAMTKEQVEVVLQSLLATRHVHEVIPTFGDKYTYKLGSVGHTLAHAVKKVFLEGMSELSEERVEAS